ncbi:CPBP family intramembrane glutamic endopeptidase [Poritiphilus flavus]|uniref:CPBP family intramembrane metalloprotease n=1 Tax=Poritiphilus flavus TaxID=2697053 RepID=A0A6L9EF34_9FLAO|nr:CPBP family intramembrane glutamic endopeptidase [Poritiphilus flavus]NAS13273.1 CPBP family intramembrane metalloprotease [Poritiphilus flavus]
MNFSNSKMGSSIAMALVFLLLLLLPFGDLLEASGMETFKAQQLGDILKNCVIIIYGILMIRRLGFVRISGLKNTIPKYPILLIVPLYFALLGPLWYFYFGYEFHNIAAADVIILLLAMLGVGISEEVIFRGLILPNLLKGSSAEQPMLIPIVLAALLFGVLHFLNLFNADAQFPTVIAQVIYATFFGIAFGIILLRSKSLLALGVLHGIINFFNSLDDLPGAVEPAKMQEYAIHEAVFSVLVVIPFLWYALRQLPSIKRQDVLSQIDSDQLV